ncbi:MAG: hypothetical protein GY749_42115 [Desulfobacteraceae bacterium]|nr:hypothetical protein [Desulfobacteraceae bacterium]
MENVVFVETKAITALNEIDYAQTGHIHKLGDSLNILIVPVVLVPMLRVGMQGAALRADIRRAKLAWQIFVPKLVDTPNP